MTTHKTVLLKEAVDNLNLESGDVVVDATLGGGGHSLKILKKILPDGKLVAIDRDIEAIKRFKKSQISNLPASKQGLKSQNLTLVNDNFSNLENILDSLKISKVDAILADFGLSSDQLDSTERGFSFLSDANLDMRMSQSQELTAEYIVNNYSEDELRKIFWDYGEEKYTKQIVRGIVEKRKDEKIKTTFNLAEVIEKAVPEKYKRQKIHFATKIFQALRIEVNDELKSIDKFIRESIKRLKMGGRLVVISFHSGEDRIAKNIFKSLERGCDCPPEFPICQCGKKSQIKIITKKPIIANEKEIKENPRSRSAKLRVVEKIQK